jgi:hypothetical protein
MLSPFRGSFIPALGKGCGDVSSSTRDALAKAILQSAQDGETDPARLKTQALAALLANAPKV